MKAVLLTMSLMCSLATVWAGTNDVHERRLQEERTWTFPSCETLVPSRVLCERLREAREMAEQVQLTLRGLINRAKNDRPVMRIRTRPFVLVAYDEVMNQWHIINLEMPLSGNATFQPTVLSRHDPPYVVRRLRGTSYLKMVFEVRVGERKLLPYAAKHVYLTGAPTRESTDSILYLSTPPHLAHPELAKVGKDYVMSILREARNELEERKVRSKAYPGKLLADVVTEEMLYLLLVTEQTDPCLLKRSDPACAKIPGRLFESDEQVVDAVLAQFVIVGLNAYRDICSAANACGAFQFTNTPNRQYQGTYHLVRTSYPLAELDPDFKRGTKGFRNSAKAAALLVDLMLAVPATPPWVRALFLEDARFGMLFPSVAYNGGESQSRVLAQLVERFAREQRVEQLRFETFPWETFFAWASAQPRGLKAETFGYLQKAVDNWGHLNRYDQLTESAPVPPIVDEVLLPGEEGEIALPAEQSEAAVSASGTDY